MAADTGRVSPITEVEEGEATVLDAIAKPASVLEQLRAQREELKADHTLDLDIPGYKGMLLVRYGHVSIRRAEQMGKALMKEPKDQRQFLGSVDTLIEACQGVYIRQEGYDEPQPIDPSWPTPTLFDEHLASLLGFESETKTARDVVRGVYPSDHAILRHNIILAKWMQDVTADLSEDLLGE